VAIRHDVTNAASAAVAVKAGFVEARRIDRDPEAPGEPAPTSSGSAAPPLAGTATRAL